MYFFQLKNRPMDGFFSAVVRTLFLKTLFYRSSIFPPVRQLSYYLN